MTLSPEERQSIEREVHDRVMTALAPYVARRREAVRAALARPAAGRDVELRERVLEGAIAARRFPPERREQYRALYDEDPERAVALIAQLQPLPAGVGASATLAKAPTSAPAGAASEDYVPIPETRGTARAPGEVTFVED